MTGQIEIEIFGGAIALISPRDEERVRQVKTWRPLVKKTAVYVGGSYNGKSTELHRFIMQPPKGFQVDHINFDGFDNRRENLRLSTHSQNMAHSRTKVGVSGYRGVLPSGRNWQANITVKYKVFRSCAHLTAEDAARAYDRMALEHFGEFAMLNFPGEIST